MDSEREFESLRVQYWIGRFQKEDIEKEFCQICGQELGYSLGCSGMICENCSQRFHLGEYSID